MIIHYNQIQQWVVLNRDHVTIIKTTCQLKSGLLFCTSNSHLIDPVKLKQCEYFPRNPRMLVKKLYLQNSHPRYPDLA